MSFTFLRQVLDTYLQRPHCYQDTPFWTFFFLSFFLAQATQEDNPDRYALTTMTLSRRGYYSTQLQFIQRDYVATVLENLPQHSVIAPTIINKNIDQVCIEVLSGSGWVVNFYCESWPIEN